MRPLKFRAWDAKEKKFGYISVHSSGLHWPSTTWTEQHLSVTKDSVPQGIIFENVKAIQQFTGLLDKNGVEVYEGDIVRDGSGHITKVVYDLEHTGWKFAHTDCVGCYVRNVGVEVIGNIFQNPSLIDSNGSEERTK